MMAPKYFTDLKKKDLFYLQGDATIWLGLFDISNQCRRRPSALVSSTSQTVY